MEEQDTKRCPNCQIVKPLSEFSRRGTGKQGYCALCVSARSKAYYAANKDKLKARSRAWAAAHPELVQEYRQRHKGKHLEYTKKYNRTTKFGLTEAEYDGMLAAQGFGCAVCGYAPVPGQPRLNIDHDHGTGRVRALLCGNCNTALGMLKDDLVRACKLAAYMIRDSLKS